MSADLARDIVCRFPRPPAEGWDREEATAAVLAWAMLNGLEDVEATVDGDHMSIKATKVQSVLPTEFRVNLNAVQFGTYVQTDE